MGPPRGPNSKVVQEKDLPCCLWGEYERGKDMYTKESWHLPSLLPWSLRFRHTLYRGLPEDAQGGFFSAGYSTRSPTPKSTGVGAGGAGGVGGAGGCGEGA